MVTMSRFNSLQTGRHIQTNKLIYPTRMASQFQFPSNGKAHSDSSNTIVENTYLKFQFPSNGKAHSDSTVLIGDTATVSFGFNSLQTGRHIQTLGSPACRDGAIVSIPFKREGTFRQTPISTHTGRGSRDPKTKHELREAFFSRKFIPKTAQTPINTQPNAIF